MTRIILWIVAVATVAVIGSLIAAGLLSTNPGLFPLVALLGLWWFDTIPEYDIDAELASLLNNSER